MTRREAFIALFAAHFLTIVRYVERRTGSTALAEDIAEDTFELAWTVMDRQEIELPWLYKAAGFKIKEYARRARRARSAQAAIEREFAEAPATLDTLERLAVRDALAVLTRREREVVELTYWEQLRAAEIAAILDCREATVWVTLGRARKKLAPCLAEFAIEEVVHERR